MISLVTLIANNNSIDIYSIDLNVTEYRLYFEYIDSGRIAKIFKSDLLKVQTSHNLVYNEFYYYSLCYKENIDISTYNLKYRFISDYQIVKDKWGLVYPNVPV